MRETSDWANDVTTHTVKLTPSQGKVLEGILRKGAYDLKTVPHARVSGAKKDVVVTLYESGKLVVQGKGTKEFVEFVLEPEVIQEARVGYEEVLQPELMDPRIGVDESGKGDFFGPMCIAGVYVNKSVLEKWKNAGIRDSKNIGSDAQVARLAGVIRETPGCVVNVVTIGNEAYNRMYKINGSVNRILAWGHARVIENLMSLRYQMKPEPVRVISDQFAATEDTVRQALMSMGKQIELVQRHKAESDMAVAAASILARHEFVTRLGRLGVQWGVEMPKGASEWVIQAAKKLVEKDGETVLGKVAKVHFRTTYIVLGQPVPEKKAWQKPKKK